MEEERPLDAATGKTVTEKTSLFMTAILKCSQVVNVNHKLLAIE